jgi:N-acetylmuramate 1-kinase
MGDEKAAKSVWRLDISDEAGTIALAHDIASLLTAGDMVTLAGDLGSGKTTFARALIRDLLHEPALEAPSPTFTLMQIYEGETLRIVHADFYRIDEASELAGLGWEEAVDDAVVLVEWAERTPDALPADRLDIRLSFTDAPARDARRVTISGYGAFAPRLNSFKALRELLRKRGWDEAQRSFLMGDASTRAYERLEKSDGQRAILMISPPRPDGPPVRYGKPYSAIARLAETVKPFVAVADGLRAHGLSAPEIYGADLDAGLLIVEDLGPEGVIDADGPIPARYLEAAAALAHLHAQKLPDRLPVEGTSDYVIPPYDMDALLIEVDLLLDWYVPHLKTSVASGPRAIFVNLWRNTLLDVINGPRTWALRDYHSPNLIWLEGREGVRRVGVIDFQDCVLGHPAYDMASLGQDARVTVSDELELKLLAHYARLRREADATFDMAEFARAYSILAAQRATKVLGIFARLNQRDGKPHYLAHLPRIEAYLKKCLRHPALAALKGWYEANLPQLFGDA